MPTIPIHPTPRFPAACRFAVVFCTIAVGTAIVPFAPASAGAAEYVVHISVDGLRPDGVTSQSQALLPNFYRLRNEGAFTDNARTDFTHTITLPNHSSMISGRPVSGAAGHNYTSNSDPASTSVTLHSNKGSYVASAFDVAHDNGLRTGMYTTKSKFSLYNQSYDGDSASLQGGAPDANLVDGDHGRDKIDTYYYNSSSTNAVSTWASNMTANPFHYSFIHIHNPDSAGHASGWMSSSYLNSIVDADNRLGVILSTIENNLALDGNTTIILSADHGGMAGTTDHGTASDMQNYTIPFYVWGAGVAHGDLYAFNSGIRTDPGAGRPDYNAAGQPIRNGDGGNLALSLLGLGPIPGSLINATQNLRVALPGDFNLDNAVDAADYVAWSKGVGTAAIPSQYDLWRANFGTSLAVGSAAQVPFGSPVPEPTPCALAMAVMFFMAFCRRWAC